VVRYPYHPLTGQSVLVVGETEHGGALHLIIRKRDGAKLLLPAWMTFPESSSVNILSCPRLSVNRLLDLRALLDRLMASSSPHHMPGGGRNNESMETPQADLFKTPHELAPSQRTTAVALLKALLIEAICAQTSAATDAELSTAEGNDVEIGEDVGE
jgi:hypothetical protein